MEPETAVNASGSPVEPANRALGPDLARGFLLLFIALANSHYFVQGPAYLGGYPINGSPFDSLTIWLLATFTDGRTFPLFGLLFGCGVAHIVARQDASDRGTIRRLLWRRSLILTMIGVVDAVLFYVGDILPMYGVLLFSGVWLVHWKERWLLLLVFCLLGMGFLPGGDPSIISPDPPSPALLPPDIATQIRERLAGVAFVGLLGPLGFLGPFAFGLVLGRREVLERPESHRRFLLFLATLGILAGVLGAQPAALVLAGVTPRPDGSQLSSFGSLHAATGVLGGLGYAALAALLAIRLQRGRHRFVDVLVATGQRSMTCYLMQSLIWCVTFTPFLLGLSDNLTVSTTALLALGTWLASVLLADWMRRTGRRGPFETLVRRVTYRIDQFRVTT